MTDTSAGRLEAYEAYVRECLDGWPPLTAEQIATLSALFNYPTTE